MMTTEFNRDELCPTGKLTILIMKRYAVYDYDLG